MGKIRDLFKKIRDTKGTFHAKMGTIKDRNYMDLQKLKILRRGGKNTQKNYIRVLTMPKALTVWITTNWKTLQVMGISDRLLCILATS